MTYNQLASVNRAVETFAEKQFPNMTDEDFRLILRNPLAKTSKAFYDKLHDFESLKTLISKEFDLDTRVQMRNAAEDHLNDLMVDAIDA